MTLIEGLYFMEDERGNHYAKFDGRSKRSDHLPNGIYKFTYTATPTGEIYKFEKRGSRFELPPTRYGDHARKVDMVVADYDRLNPAYGAIAVGLKGSGKSMLFNDICNKLGPAGIPTILVEENISAAVMRRMIAMVGPCIVYLDEFGKTFFDYEERISLLGLFSDASLKGVLFLVTGNHINEFSEFIIDRPQRFRYRFDMMEVDNESLTDFFDKNHIPRRKLAWLASIRSSLSFDVLTCIMPALRGSNTVQEFIAASKYLNVPTPLVGCLRVIVVYYKSKILEKHEGTFELVGSKLLLSVNFEMDGETITGQYEKDLIGPNGLLCFDSKRPFPIGPCLVTLDAEFGNHIPPEVSMDDLPFEPYVFNQSDLSLHTRGSKSDNYLQMQDELREFDRSDHAVNRPSATMKVLLGKTPTSMYGTTGNAK